VIDRRVFKKLQFLAIANTGTAVPRLETAAAAPGEGFTGCYRTLLRDVSAFGNSPALETVALRHLDEPDPEVVEDAAIYLRTFGSAAAEEPLWARFSEWGAQWRGRWPELQAAARRGNMSRAAEVRAGEQLLRALGEGPGWLPDETDMLRLVDLSVGDSQRVWAERYLETWRQQPWTIVYRPDPVQFNILQYQMSSPEAARTKLSQFPSGAVFQWTIIGSPAGEDERAFQELSTHARTLGIRIERAPNP